MLNSAVYEGWVRHRRHAPHPHAFRYRLAQPFLDLDEIDQALASNRWFSRERRNLGVFRRSDYLGDPDQPLAEAVRARVAEHTGAQPAGPIRLLAHLRYFGHCFNPVAFYYCYAADGETLHTIVAEITNTPWKERHAYVLPVAEGERHGSALHFAFDKRFHVSPFLPMDRRYHWRLQAPGESLRVHMDVLDGKSRQFDATLVMRRRALDRLGLNRCLWRFLPMTLKVVSAIHWQAFLIWCRHNPVYDHPGKSRKPLQ
jgi:uncharacterized protein